MQRQWLWMLTLSGWLVHLGLAVAQSPLPGQPAEEKGGAKVAVPVQTEGAFCTGDAPPGNCCAWDAVCEAPCCAPLRCQLGLDYCFVWFTKNTFPGAAITTTTNLSAPVPGALGDPNTIVLGGTHFGDLPASAGRISLLYWVGDPGKCSVDVRYMAMEQRTSVFSVSSDGSPNSAFIGRPFFNPVTGREDVDPRAIPNVMAGNANVNFTTRFQQAESNVRCYFGCPQGNGIVSSVLVGGRFFQLHELYSSPDTVTDLPVNSPSAQTFFINDRFATYNDFYGGQIGFSTMWRYDCFSVEILGKLAAGVNLETTKISGETTITNQLTGQSVSDSIGLYAQRSNSGNRRSTHFAYIPELEINLGALMWDRVRFKVGYNLLCMEQVLRPGSLIDRNVNIQPLLAPTQIGVALPQYNGGSRTGFLLQAVTFGVEILY